MKKSKKVKGKTKMPKKAALKLAPPKSGELWCEIDSRLKPKRQIRVSEVYPEKGIAYIIVIGEASGRTSPVRLDRFNGKAGGYAPAATE